MNKQQEPRLRFKGFTGAWEEKVLGEILSVRNEFVDSSLYDLDVELENLISNSGILVGDTSVRTQTTSLFRKGDILFGRLRPYLNKWWFAEKDGVKSGEIWALETSSKYSNSFAYLLVQSRKFLEIANVTSGTKMPRADWRSLTAITFNSPSKLEQTHLGNFFRCLDSQIAESRAVLEKSRQLKKAMLAKMFPANGEKTPKIRFKGFEGEWECRKLGDLMNVTSVKRIHQSDWTNEGVRFLRARDIVAFNKGEKIEEPLFISKEKYNEYSEISGKVKIGDLLVTGVGTIGVPYLIEDEDPLYFKDGNVIWFQNENKIGGLFFYYSFLNNFIQDFIIETAGIGTVGTYTIDTGKKTPIFLPPTKSEQTAIGNFFRQLDETIALQSAEGEKLNQLKKGRLAAMLV